MAEGFNLTRDHIHVSQGISKLGPAIPSINLPPGITCDPRAGCYKKCYARKGRFAFSHTKSLLKKNLEIWQEHPEDYEQDALVASFYARFFRFHSSGDIPDMDYLAMMTRVADNRPNTQFLCFTKKFELVNGMVDRNDISVIPENLHIVFSAWGSFIPDNPYNFPMAWIRFRKESTYIPEDAFECAGYCGECVQTGHSCWDLKPGENVVFNEH